MYFVMYQQDDMHICNTKIIDCVKDINSRRDCQKIINHYINQYSFDDPAGSDLRAEEMYNSLVDRGFYYDDYMMATYILVDCNDDIIRNAYEIINAF